jgi:DNA polymerase-3 subunit delta'
MRLTSQVIVTARPERAIEELVAQRSDERIVVITTPQEAEGVRCPEGLGPDACIVYVTERSTFRVEDARLAIEKAYMASKTETVIVLIAKEFPPLIQNKLLKVIEEPPPQTTFILITASKATILPTIRSRLPITVLKDRQEMEAFELDVAQLDLASVYAFIQKYKRPMDKADAKVLLEHIVADAIKSRRYTLDEKSLDLFTDAFRALDVGSQPQFVLMTVLLKLLAKTIR